MTNVLDTKLALKQLKLQGELQVTARRGLCTWNKSQNSLRSPEKLVQLGLEYQRIMRQPLNV